MKCTHDICEMFTYSKAILMAFYYFRLQILKTSFEKNIHHSVDCEENIFTSEVV